MKFKLQSVEKIGAEIGEKFIIYCRLSVIDCVDDGNTMDKVITMVNALEKAGITLIYFGIGWHTNSNACKVCATCSFCGLYG